MLKRSFVFLARLLLFVALVWLVVLAYWKYTKHVVSSEDLLIYFFVLPVALVLAYLFVRLLWWAVKKTFHRIGAPAAVQPATVHAGASADGGTREPSRAAYVISTALCTHFGEEGAQCLDAILQENKRAGISDEITRALGYGVRAAEVDRLEVAAAHEETRVTMVRTRALLERIYAQLEGVLHRAAPGPNSTDGSDKGPTGATLHPAWNGVPGQDIAAPANEIQAAADGTMPASLRVHIVLPVFLTAPEAGLIQTDVTEWLQAAGWPRQAVVATTIQPENEVEYLKRLEAWQRPVSSDAAASEWLLILSAVSWLDVDLLNDRLRTDAKFANRLEKGGTVIGEAACGVVLAKSPPASRLQLEPLARLSQLTLAQRNKPVDAKGTIEAGLLAEMLADQASALNDPELKCVGLTVSGDMSDGRAVELGRWVTDDLPQLDFIDDVLSVAEHLGECGPAGNLLALALAAAMVQQRNGSVLYCSNQHASWRALAAVMPAA